MKTPKNMNELFELWNSLEFQNDLGITPQNAWNMRAAGRIPYKYWPKVLVKSKRRGIKLTLPMLEKLHEKDS